MTTEDGDNRSLGRTKQNWPQIVKIVTATWAFMLVIAFVVVPSGQRINRHYQATIAAMAIYRVELDYNDVLEDRVCFGEYREFERAHRVAEKAIPQCIDNPDLRHFSWYQSLPYIVGYTSWEYSHKRDRELQGVQVCKVRIQKITPSWLGRWAALKEPDKPPRLREVHRYRVTFFKRAVTPESFATMDEAKEFAADVLGSDIGGDERWGWRSDGTATTLSRRGLGSRLQSSATIKDLVHLGAGAD